MKPVTQTRFGDPEGNCLMAAVASILECDLSECPDLYEAEKEDRNWWDVMVAFLRPRGYFPVWLDPKQWGQESFIVPKGWSIVSGDSERGVRHVVVTFDGEVRHDPHPERSGIVKGTERGYIALLPLAGETQ